MASEVNSEVPGLIAKKLSVVVQGMVRNVYLQNQPGRLRFGQHKAGSLNFISFLTIQRPTFGSKFWQFVVSRCFHMCLGVARWSSGVSWWLPGITRCILEILEILKVFFGVAGMV